MNDFATKILDLAAEPGIGSAIIPVLTQSEFASTDEMAAAICIALSDHVALTQG